jgi:outer membrane biosynthesis protein TonB
MRFAGVPRSILLLLPTFALACAQSSPSAPEQIHEAAPGPQAAAEPSVDAAAEPSAAKLEEEAKPATADMPARAPAPAPGGGEPPSADADRSQSRLDIAVPSINGGLNRDIIRRIATDHADEIRECHGRALASMPELLGKLVVEVELDADGNVKKAKIGEDSSLNHRDVESCVIALIEGWSFRDAGGKGSAALSFEF